MEGKLQAGTKHGAWQVLRAVTYSKYLCICTACAETVQTLRRHDLVSGKSIMCKSCSNKATSRKTTKQEEVYNTWIAMNQRCNNPSCKDYANYGGRGIEVDPLWQDSFEAFYMYIGDRPNSGDTIERLDYNKGYFPGNVKWLPRSEQSKNKRDNVNLTLWDETKLVSEWAADSRITIDQFTIYKRIQRGWDPAAALQCPVGTRQATWKKNNG